MRLSLAVLGLLLTTGLASAAIFADFDPARHDRFVAGDPADPDPLNPTFLLDHSTITGVGLTPAVLISPQHYLTATHYFTNSATFVAADGTRHTYAAHSRTALQTTLTSDFTLSNGTVLPAGSVHGSDLTVVRLANPISPADGIDPMPLFGGSFSSLAGRDINLFVQSNRAGRDTADFAQTAELLNTGAITESLLYRYDNPPGQPASDELYFAGGDSGRGSLTEINGQMALVGIHLGVGTDSNTGDTYSFDSYVQPYLDQIQAIVGQDGFQINVVAVPEPASIWFTLAVALTAASVTALRRQTLTR
ncbi:PEP-CTERM sorting domain-containing protein [Allorhodopirellula solitaria]|nr:PEP-CTERM sorting domain-containing protein [Allorhodopirellula solitaria]